MSPDASFVDIKKAYRQRAKELHPDVSKNSTDDEDFVAVNVSLRACGSDKAAAPGLCSTVAVPLGRQ